MRDYGIIDSDTGTEYPISVAPLHVIERALQRGFMTDDDITAESARERLKIEIEIRTLEGRL